MSDTKLEEQTITVRPRKISSEAYTQLLESLEIRLPALIALGLQRHGAFTGLESSFGGVTTIAMELARLRKAITGNPERIGLAQVLNNLASDPYKVLTTTQLWMPREQARRPHPSGLTQAMSRLHNLDANGLPIRMLDTRVEHRVDVYENCLIKVYN